jgi:GntR family transcriptional regulator, transcriptional repressor for pyruvate dehydrogenase complex
MPKPLNRHRLYEQIADQIKNRIVKGWLKNGDQLPNERDLAGDYGVSRTVVREAIKTLVQSGLIEVRTGEGTFVNNDTSKAFKHSLKLMMSLSESDRLSEVVEIREMLEPEIAARAAERATPADLESLEAAIAAMDQNLDSSADYIAADNQFHLALAVATGNHLLPGLLDSVVDLLNELRAHIFIVKGGPERGQIHHRDILKAVRNHSPERARRAMSSHLEQVKTDCAAGLKHSNRGKSASKLEKKLSR